MRGCAILLVLLHHYGGVAARGSHNPFVEFLLAGWTGVDLFFVLSGFLITSVILRSMHRPRWMRTFYIRRALRIAPLYYATLAVMLLVMPRFLPVYETIQPILDHQWALWLYVMNYVRISFDEWWLYLGHFWSLAVEEQFYLVWPAMLALIGRRRWKVALLAFIVLIFIAQIAVALSGTALTARIHAFRPIGIMAGSALALIWPLDGSSERPWRPRWLKWIAILCALITLAAIIAGVMHDLFYPSTIAKIAAMRIIVFAAVIFLFVALVDAARRPTRLSPLLSHRVLRFFGRYSYGIYVFHWLMVPAYTAWFGDLAPAAYIALASVITTVMAIVSFELLERPFQKLKPRV